ncbi:MAG: hypothetical protein GX608_05365 [Lentisphaerae bacterium]|nr:hypothetical protein [Lentisphaerota bacterium]
MISFATTESDRLREALALEIAGEIAAIDRADGRKPDDALCAEVAMAVAETLAGDRGAVRVRGSDLTYLIAKSLWSVGEDVRARRCLDMGHPGHPLAADAVCSPDSSLLVWRACFSRGLLREEPHAPVGGAAWILDCAKLAESLGMALELTLSNAMNAILRRIAFIWDRTRGRGLLGLRRFDAFSPGSGRRRAEFRREILALCRARLEALRDARQWEEAPCVIHWELR